MGTLGSEEDCGEEVLGVGSFCTLGDVAGLLFNNGKVGILSDVLKILLSSNKAL